MGEGYREAQVDQREAELGASGWETAVWDMFYPVSYNIAVRPRAPPCVGSTRGPWPTACKSRLLPTLFISPLSSNSVNFSFPPPAPQAATPQPSFPSENSGSETRVASGLPVGVLERSQELPSQALSLIAHSVVTGHFPKRFPLLIYDKEAVSSPCAREGK